MTEAAGRAYAAARERAAAGVLPARGVLAVTGPQRVKFLHNLLSNDLAARRPGEGVRAALMDVKGRILVLLRALVDEDAVLLEMPADRVDTVEKILVHYKVAAPVRFARRPVAALGVVGPRAAEVLRTAGATVAEDLRTEGHVLTALGGRPARVVRAGDLPAGGWVVQVAPEDAAPALEAIRAAGAEALDEATLEALRIEDGRPWYGSDVTEENLLHETGLVGEYHSPSKGCYVGQEVVARLEARGAHVNKVLRGLRLEAPVARAAAVSAGGREVGRVTTAGVSPRLGAIAMAYVHRSAAEPRTEVEVAGVKATVEALPLTG